MRQIKANKNNIIIMDKTIAPLLTLDWRFFLQIFRGCFSIARRRKHTDTHICPTDSLASEVLLEQFTNQILSFQTSVCPTRETCIYYYYYYMHCSNVRIITNNNYELFEPTHAGSTVNSYGRLTWCHTWQYLICGVVDVHVLVGVYITWC